MICPECDQPSYRLIEDLENTELEEDHFDSECSFCGHQGIEDEGNNY